LTVQPRWTRSARVALLDRLLTSTSASIIG